MTCGGATGSGARSPRSESELDGLRVEDPLEAEIVVHRRFLEERAAHFAGREDKLADVARHLDGTAPQPLYVSGVSGAGQSAFMAGAALATVADARGALVVARCVGATSPSVDARLLLDGITRELARASGEPDPVMPGNLDDVAVEIVRYEGKRSHVVRASDIKPYTIPIARLLVTDLSDALDELAAVFTFHGFCKHQMHKKPTGRLDGETDHYRLLLDLLAEAVAAR